MSTPMLFAWIGSNASGSASYNVHKPSEAML